MTSRPGSARRILGIWRKLVELRLDTGREELTYACSRRTWAGVARDGGGGRWKSQDRKIVPFSPYVEKPLNSKVIKSFLSEQRSHECFSCFVIPMFYVYINEHYMSISHIRIWVWYRSSHGVVVNIIAILNFSRTLTFTFGLIPFRKVRIPLVPLPFYKDGFSIE